MSTYNENSRNANSPRITIKGNVDVGFVERTFTAIENVQDAAKRIRNGGFDKPSAKELRRIVGHVEGNI